MRESTYQASLAVLHEHGPDGLTMDRVAAAANVAKGSLYNYFQNKQDLLAFVFDKVVEPARTAAEKVALSDLPPVDKLRGVIEALFQNFAEKQAVFRALMNSDDARAALQPTERCVRGNTTKIFAAIINEGIQKKVFRSVDSIFLGRCFLAAIVELIEMHDQAGREPTELNPNQILDLFLNGVLLANKAG